MVARSLGAKVQDRITRDTTHVVAARAGTAKVNDAKKHKNIHLGKLFFLQKVVIYRNIYIKFGSTLQVSRLFLG